jgi:putative PIN family toxin of toxin-antitoxin system
VTLWAVLDTNTWVSGFGWDGPPREVVDRWAAGEFLAVVSPPLLRELHEVLRRDKFADVFPQPDDLLALVEAASVLVEPESKLALLADEADNRLLEAAAAADADYIVTGDKPALDFGRYDRTKIVNARRFVEVLGEQRDR